MGKKIEVFDKSTFFAIWSINGSFEKNQEATVLNNKVNNLAHVCAVLERAGYNVN